MPEMELTNVRPNTYDRIAAAIVYINENFKSQPTLDEIAAAAGVSRYHFQRLFSAWAGISPKKFVQYLTLEHAKEMLLKNESSLFDAAMETGLSGTGRLHDLFIGIERMTPGEFRKGGESLRINVAEGDSPFGKLLVASTAKGVWFDTDDCDARAQLVARFPNAVLTDTEDRFQKDALSVFQRNRHASAPVKLHVKSTPFQLKVWECLLKIPPGRLATYGMIARSIGQPGAGRAVGAAVGKNPIALLIPCHRVIQATGRTGGYRWGQTRKKAIIARETATPESLDER